MNVRQRKRLFILSAAVLALGGVAVLYVGWATPVRVEPPEHGGATTRTPTSSNEATVDDVADASRLSLDELQQLCATDLRPPLFDPPPPTDTRTVAAPRPAPMTVRLIGTVFEPGHSMAMFQKRDGGIELCAEGERVDDAGGEVVVTRIDRQVVTVVYAGRTRQLEVPPPAGGGR